MEAIASIQRYFEASREKRIRNMAARGLLGFFIEEISPVICNQAVADMPVATLHAIKPLLPEPVARYIA